MEVRPGYKHTEDGVIPNDWGVAPLGDVADFLDGRRRPVKDSDRAKMRGDIPYYGASGIVDYVDSYLFDEDLILLGEDGENILSRNCRLAFKISGKTWVNNHAHVLRPKAGLELNYLVEFLESRNYAKYNTGTAQPKLNKQVCSRIPVLCPPVPEQRAIATALNDVDTLLDGLDKLIAKKRNLKQAAMQQLLTGQTRLPGFHGKWDVKPLRLLASIAQGQVDPKIIPYRSMYLIGPEHVESGTGKLLTRRTALEQGAISGKYLFKKGDVVYGKINPYLRKAFLANFDGLCSADMYPLRAVDGVAPGFLLATILGREFSTYSESVSVRSGMPKINREEMAGFSTKVPKDLDEQTAIAAVLSDMDAELSAVEARRDKTRALKQGMMQELLTGKTRLVPTGDAHA